MLQRMVRWGMTLALAWLGVVGLGGQETWAGPKVPKGIGRGEHLTAVVQTVEIPTIDDVPVRIPKPKDQFDENGKKRQLTFEEYRAAKGSNPSLPGYTAQVSDLKSGQVLKLTLQKKKEQPKSSSKDGEADKETKTEWVAAGTMNAIMKDFQDSTKTLTVEVASATLTGKHNYGQTNSKKGKDNKISLDNYRVKMIEIVREPAKDTNKKAKN